MSKKKREQKKPTDIIINGRWIIRADTRRESRSFFDLYEKGYIKALGYSYSLEGALREIAKRETVDVLEGDTITLKDYMKELRKQRSELIELIKK